MKRTYWIGPGPSLLLAAGIIASTVVAKVASESSWLVLAGPLVMAFALVGASVLGVRLGWASRATIRIALVLGASLVLAGVIVALRDPARLAAIMPILGGGAAAVIGANLGRWPQEKGDVVRGV